MKQICIVDAHPAVGYGIAQSLSGAFPGVNIWCASSTDELRAKIPYDLLDGTRRSDFMAFVDTGFENGSGTHTIRELHDLGIPVVAMCDHNETTKMQIYAGSGAVVVVSKIVGIEVYAAIAHLIFSRATFFPVESLQSGKRMPSPTAVTPLLTVRQREVLQLLNDGYPNKVIAATLGISEGTVKNYVSNLLDRFKVNSRSQLMLRTLS